MSGIRDWLASSKPSLSARLLRPLLIVLSWPYALAMRLRGLAYRLGWAKSYDGGLPIISVGNLSVGGTGKTPMVAYLADWFRRRDVRVAIVSRGYGQLEHGTNDEALELELRLPDVPHIQNPDRVAAVQLARDELEMQLVLLDDGFQHRRLRRDLDIVLLDATDPPHVRRVLPAGLLREPMSALTRAQVVMLTRCSQVTPERLRELKQLVARTAPQACCISSSHLPRRLRRYPDETWELERLRGAKVIAFCAIGNGAAFFASLGSLGATVCATRQWRDHHAYTQEDLAELARLVAQNGEAVMLVCTMKDWVKLQVPSIGGRPLVALEIDLLLEEGTAEFEDVLSKLLERLKT